MSYFSYHGRNKNLIKKGLLLDYFYEDNGTRLLILVFRDGRRFPIKEERWTEYHRFIEKYYEEGGKK